MKCSIIGIGSPERRVAKDFIDMAKARQLANSHGRYNIEKDKEDSA